MKIVKRHKNEYGEVIGYTLDDNGMLVYYDYIQAISRQNMITNAKLRQNGDYIANKGEHIETVVDSLKLIPIKKVRHDVVDTINISFYGIQFIDVALKIRNYASLGKIEVDLTKHKSNNGLNTHFFKIIEACGIKVKDFVTVYLSNLQPYSLKKFMPSKKDIRPNNIWLSDVGYKVALVIKIDETRKERPLVISFHEGNIGGHSTILATEFDNMPCAVFYNRISDVGNNEYEVEYNVQRGFINSRMKSTTKYIATGKGYALVNYSKIKNKFNNILSSEVSRLIKFYSESNDSEVVASIQDNTVYNKVSFTSLGFNDINNLSMLIDMFAVCKGTQERLLVTEITSNILDEIPAVRLREIQAALRDKLSGSRNKLFLLIDSY